MKKSIVIILLAISWVCNAREWTAGWGATARFAGSTGTYMPFWARTGEDGTLPVTSSGLLRAGAKMSYKDDKDFFFDTGLAFAGAVALPSPLNDSPAYGMIDRLYVSGGWKMLRLDLGWVPRRGELGGMSVTGGDFMFSGNARTMPGVNLSSDWIYFESGRWVGVRGNFSHYWMTDNRYMMESMLHDKSLNVKVALGRKVDLVLGFHHYAQWGGHDRDMIPQPHSFSDYVRVLFAQRGGEDALKTDQLNVLGNHLGREWVRVVWRASGFDMTFQYDKPFEDDSGRRFRNFPDGVWTLQFVLKDRDGWISDVTCEVINTTWQSGDLHDRPATEEEMKGQDKDDPYYGKVVLGGRDDYFNNHVYRSGWTNFGRIMGLPLILPGIPGADGYVSRIVNNRVRGYHLGLEGLISRRLPYRFKATYTENFGCYSQAHYSAFAFAPWQLSLAFETDLPDLTPRLPVVFSAGAYADFGKVYQNGAGLTLCVSFRDSRSLR